MRPKLACLLAGALAALTLPAPAASAAPAHSCVGLVVSHGATTRTACVPYRSGLTGQQVLQRAGFRLTFDNTGFICEIDRYPAACKADNHHFWGYWHRAPGATAWKFSDKGANAYRVRPGETEGWAYVNGGNADRKPPAIAYASLSRSKAAGPDPGGGGGTPWGLIAGIVVAVLVVAAALWQVQVRRRRAA